MKITKGFGFAIAGSLLVMLVAVPALAARVNGLGRTHRYATLGFVARSDLSGHLRYLSRDHRFMASCSRYTSFKRSRTKRGASEVRLTARCHRDNGRRVFLKATFVDRGPGRRDWARIAWGRRRHFTWKMALIRDRGRIRAGTIQVG
jgi:hypothetical protein